MGTAAAAAATSSSAAARPISSRGPLGAPVKAPPMPFSAPLTLGVVPYRAARVRPAVTVGSTGLNTPPHVGLHPADPFSCRHDRDRPGDRRQSDGARRWPTAGTYRLDRHALRLARRLMGTAATVLVA